MDNRRMSMYSLGGESMASRNMIASPGQVSTTSLLNIIHANYLSSQPHQIDATTAIVVNTWLHASQPGPNGSTGYTVDASLASRAWEHARRRAEDGCILLTTSHPSSPSLLVPFLQNVPMNIPSVVFRALEAIRPFVSCVTPENPSASRHAALNVTLNINLAGDLTGATIALSQSGIDTDKGLLNVPAKPGYRAFDAFYYLLTSVSTPAEREFLGLQEASEYIILSRSQTYSPPSYLPTADDSAAADDFRSALKDIGIRGPHHRDCIAVLAGILKLGNTIDYSLQSEELDDVFEDVAGIFGVEPEMLAQKLSTDERQVFIAGLYEALVDWVIGKANQAIAAELQPNVGEDSVSLSVVEVPDLDLGRAISLRTVFDDSTGIIKEMIDDGIPVTAPSSTVVREMQSAVADCAPDLGIMHGTAGRQKQHDLERREVVLEKVALESENECFLRKVLFPKADDGIVLGRHGRFDLSVLVNSSRVWHHISLYPTDDLPASLASLPTLTSAWSAGAVSRQLRSWRLADWANRRNKQLDFTADFDVEEFVQRYAYLGCREGRQGIETFMLERGWSNGEVVIGKERVWMREIAWWGSESMLDMNIPAGGGAAGGGGGMPMGMSMGSVNTPGGVTGYSGNGSGFFLPPALDSTPTSSRDQLIHQRNLSASQSQITLGQAAGGMAAGAAAGAVAGAASGAVDANAAPRSSNPGDYGLGNKGDTYKGQVYYNQDGEFIGNIDSEAGEGAHMETNELTKTRRIWVAVVWALTFWIPSFLLSFVGRMKRPDVRMAWREKVVLVFIIFLLNAMIVFFIVGFGKLLCPNFDKAWTQSELLGHTGDDDFWVGIHGKVYDISKFWRLQHSDMAIETTSDRMQPLAGLVLDGYFPIPLKLSCRGLDAIKDSTQLQVNDTSTIEMSDAMHRSGDLAVDRTSALGQSDWYTKKFTPKIKEFYHGDLVWKASDIKNDGKNNQHMWVVYQGGVYDLTDYFYTQKLMKNVDEYKFLNSKVEKIVKEHPGEDVTELWTELIEGTRDRSESANIQNSISCITNTFYKGKPDFRKSPRCQVSNNILLAFTVVICAVILVKFLAALQFGSKRRPSPQDKFVICQVPAYTEGEDSLRKAIDSLTALQYDNKRKLICVICDGIIVGEGNDRPTPKIVLDILGVDPRVDPPALPFKSVGTGSEQLNYGKVYSGLYEFEGNVVPYIVVVKVGKESEQTMAKPGNRGKRDSQILLMSFLNRVHHRSPMNPLELEMFHQINNVIGVDPELYEYLMMVDADTSVREDSLNRLVAACANDGRIAGICGETGLENDEKTWWTMIQVYEYFISHHMAKAFESLFGSVTCLPGCFSMYRLRTVDKGKPLIISDELIREYSVCNVDTLHKKNLLALGEDRYLTTLMTKYFPTMSYKFIADAYCKTAAPESWSVLLSQRRRWINSTIHNLCELVLLKDMCGFCCFSMRFVVFLDLFSTVILPATCAYLGYMIYLIASKTGQFPLISLIMLAVVYGLQALIFILKRQWQHIGWMIIYLLAFPVYSFILPIYSFWNQDNFSWGNTRVVVGEKGQKQIVAVNDSGFDPRSIPLQRWDDYATAHNLPGRRGPYEKEPYGAGMAGMDGQQQQQQYEMDEMRSMYSGMPAGSVVGGPAAAYQQQRASYLSGMGGVGGAGGMSRGDRGSHGGSFVGMDGPGGMGMTPSGSRSMLGVPPGGGSHVSLNRLSGVSGTGAGMGMGMGAGGNRSSTALGYSANPATRSSMGLSASTSNFDFQRGHVGPDDGQIVEAIQAVLADVDLDSVTKKQVRALVTQRLQTELSAEKRAFLDRQIDLELANM